jgi:hypothetical protein
MRVSGCNNHYKFVLCAGVKAQSVTTSRFTGQVVPPSGKQLTHIVRVISRAVFSQLLLNISLFFILKEVSLFLPAPGALDRTTE